VNHLVVGRDRHPGIYQLLEALRDVDNAVDDAHGAELDHARLAGVEPGGLAIEGDSVQRK
jgi:hypothetical protein